MSEGVLASRDEDNDADVEAAINYADVEVGVCEPSTSYPRSPGDQ